MTSVIDFLKGKNVFVFDTETTGLPAKGTKWGTYWDYKMNDKYENSRIVSIAWASIANFNKNININEIINNSNEIINNSNENENMINSNANDNGSSNKIHHHLRYPEGFTEINNSHIHGIKYEDTVNIGLLLNDL